MKRIFAAVDVSPEAKRRIAAQIEGLRKEFPKIRVGWERAEKLHLTLKFLGDTTDGQLDELKIATESIAAKFPAFKLRLGNTGVFPNARNPRVLWIDVFDEPGNLAKMNNLLEDACERFGFARERRKFVPHLTIGRVREPSKARALAAKHLENAFEPVGFEVSEIVIYESILTPAGSNFQKVTSFRFN
jgi:2'-5' RNA ligase